MQTYIIRRFIQAMSVLVLVTLILFLVMRLMPGDPILLFVTQDEYDSLSASREEVDFIKHQLGLDRPLLVQYVDWMAHVLRGDLGRSIFLKISVTNEIKRALPVTLYLSIISWVISHLISIPAGIICSVRRGKWSDLVLTSLANIGVTAPDFWVGILLIYGVGLHLGWLPIQGWTPPWENFGMNLKQIIMPVFCLSLHGISGSTRQTRSAMLEVIRQDYIRTAWAKGLRERVVVIRHAVRNGIIPVVTLAGMSIPRLFGGAIFIETVFNIPGMGRMAVNALFSHDYAIVQGNSLMMTTLIVLSNLLVDISYGWIDPRIRYR